MDNLLFYGEGDVEKIFSRDRRSRNEWGCRVPAFPPIPADWRMIQGFPDFAVGLRRQRVAHKRGGPFFKDATPRQS